MSHEIRTPINGILGIGQLLHEAPLCDVQRSYVDALLSSGELLRDLVNDVLDYSKLEEGESGLQPVVFSPREMVERVVQVSLGETERKGLELIVDVSKDCPQSVEADSGKIQRILLNLINNAVKFTECGSVSVTVSGTENSLSFAIRDTGPGIPEADQGRVFEAFVQRPANAAPPAGTGLGLAICSKLSDLLGGSLTLEHPADGGALFRLDCPIRVIDTDTLDSGEAPQESGIFDVLLVEDNVVNTMVMQGFLESDGHRVDCVASGEAALERLGERLYDLVLMDIRLQGADGFEIIKRIRACDDPRIAALPILVLTADQSDESIRKFARSGANAFQAKPFSPEDLRRAVGRAFILSPDFAVSGHKKSKRNDAPVLDISVILKHRDAIGHARTDSILAAFVETAPQHKSALRAAAGCDDRTGVADIAHTLLSAAQMIGLVQLGHSAEMIERRLAAEHQPINLVSEAEVLCQKIDDGLAAISAARVPS